MATSTPLTPAESRYRALVDQLGAIVWEAVPGDGRGLAHFTFLSEGTERLLGYPPARWLADPAFWSAMIDPEHRDAVLAEIEAAVRERRPTTLEYRCRAADGRRVWLRNVVRMQDDGAGGIRLHGVVVDVTDRRAADERLQRLQRRTERQYAVAAALADAVTAADVSRALLAELIDAIGAEHATTWQVSADGHWLELLGMRGFTVEQMVGHERVSLEAPRPVADAVRTRAVRCFGTAADVDAAFPALGGVFARRGLESVLVVPLLSAGRAVGGLLACASRPHAFGRDERALATALAAQAGQALDRARLFDAERHVSVTLQRALLPRALPDVEGVELAVRYLPAAGLEAGGDFYEVLPLPDGTLWVAVGDVVGRGAAAAAAMGQLRSALRAFALLGAGPGQVLEQLSAFADTVDGAMAATAVAARLTPATGELRYACAGHPWPLLVDAGRAEFLCEGRGVPLGCMPDPTYREAAVRLSPGATLLLYTDGLTERRGIEVAAVLERMRAAAETTAGEPVRHLLDATVTASGGDAPADDVALVALRLAGIRPRPG